ncbi:MAG: hypothetical protein IKG40_00300 [Bacilli bacterium]|nr:hypothetical protein [Bacilli bacterium]
MKELNLSYEEIEKFVNHLSEEEFNFLREAVYERLVEDMNDEKKDEKTKTYEHKPRFLWEN